ncbi:hypothetical protein F511_40035 [Dorcoceras hygrometricum]|uniref:Uncharacterized protein n=1 Tax=Dorcoceras hygrometricum TaxID=472368 RepID=A0A2Z7BNB7_9LAMI|nr:hypothetical protein F511_40035 [Dorcoceras hygrometricum]
MTNDWFSKRCRTNLLKRRRILPAAGYPVARQNSATLLSAGSSRNLKTQRCNKFERRLSTNVIQSKVDPRKPLHLLINQQELKRNLPADFTQTTAFQESRAKTRFDWFYHRPVASSPNQLTRHPADVEVKHLGIRLLFQT